MTDKKPISAFVDFSMLMSRLEKAVRACSDAQKQLPSTMKGDFEHEFDADGKIWTARYKGYNATPTAVEFDSLTLAYQGTDVLTLNATISNGDLFQSVSPIAA